MERHNLHHISLISTIFQQIFNACTVTVNRVHVEAVLYDESIHVNLTTFVCSEKVHAKAPYSLRATSRVTVAEIEIGLIRATIWRWAERQIDAQLSVNGRQWICYHWNPCIWLERMTRDVARCRATSRDVARNEYGALGLCRQMAR